MNDRAILSVGLTQDFADCELRKKFMFWLELQAPINPDAKNTVQHINAVESLVQIEKYASLSVMANDMRDHLAEIRIGNNDDFNRGYQRAINLVIDKLEDIDIDTQAATSIAEIQASTLLNIATELRDVDDYETVTNFAKAINDGCC